ncbi:MAG: cytochrome C [Dissulfurispiraceae bacterium]|jgi:sulfite dehydrogenase (cytochrome) subunit B
MKRIFAIILLLAIGIGSAYSQGKDVKQITLPNIQTEIAPGAGKEKVETLCNICHSVDYITMQPPGTKAQWTATVTKMRKVFGAPINDADAEVIINYLTAHYGASQ